MCAFALFPFVPHQQARRAEFVLVRTPTQRNHNVRLGLVGIDADLAQRKRSVQWQPREDNSGKVRRLEEFHKLSDHLLVLLDHIKQNASSESDDHDVARLRVFKLASGLELGLLESLSDVRAALNRGETMVGNY